MSAASDFYLVRAEACATEAGDATLANVRERCLRAEAAWRGMAEQLLHSERLRTVRADEPKAGTP